MIETAHAFTATNWAKEPFRLNQTISKQHAQKTKKQRWKGQLVVETPNLIYTTSLTILKHGPPKKKVGIT